jgi:hypothetical protein
MRRFVSLIVLSLFFTINIFSQEAMNQTAPVVWQKYQIPEKQISIFLPKMPVVDKSTDVCGETEMKTLWAYAEDAVYQVRIASKYVGQNRKRCDEKRYFGAESFVARLNEIKKESGSADETKLMRNKREVTIIKGKIFKRWIFDDLENNKWIELAIASRDAAKSNGARFVESLEFTENPSGIIIGDGAEYVLGDERIENAERLSAKTADRTAEKTAAIVIITKPRASYTDEARQNQVKGTITLKVTFLANGGIGEVVPLNELPFSLTEQTIAAVRKIFFLPQKNNGVNDSVIKQLQYSFSIY